MPHHASQLYSRNVAALLTHLAPGGELSLDYADEITLGRALEGGANAFPPVLAAVEDEDQVIPPPEDTLEYSGIIARKAAARICHTKRKQDLIVGIFGRRGRGKSTLSLAMARRIDQEIRRLLGLPLADTVVQDTKPAADAPLLDMERYTKATVADIQRYAAASFGGE